MVSIILVFILFLLVLCLSLAFMILFNQLSAIQNRNKGVVVTIIFKRGADDFSGRGELLHTVHPDRLPIVKYSILLSFLMVLFALTLYQEVFLFAVLLFPLIAGAVLMVVNQAARKIYIYENAMEIRQWFRTRQIPYRDIKVVESFQKHYPFEKEDRLGYQVVTNDQKVYRLQTIEYADLEQIEDIFTESFPYVERTMQQFHVQMEEERSLLRRKRQ